MNIKDLSGDLRYVSSIGLTLNTEERIQLDMALSDLIQVAEAEQTLFWGKIAGIAKDYYIAVTLNFKGNYEFPFKRFFWASSNNWKFQELQPINPLHKDNAETINSYFTGDPNKILIEAVIPEQQEEQEQAQEEEKVQEVVECPSSEEEQAPPQTNFTELDRLAYVVRTIEQECQILPVGALKITVNHELAYNPIWNGLDQDQASKYENYMHFRNAQTKDQRQVLDQDDAIYKQNLLDPITSDFPQGQWSLQFNTTNHVVTLRSLLWQGYVMFHKLKTQKYGGIYLGDGVKNVDLAFLI